MGVQIEESNVPYVWYCGINDIKKEDRYKAGEVNDKGVITERQQLQDIKEIQQICSTTESHNKVLELDILGYSTYGFLLDEISLKLINILAYSGYYNIKYHENECYSINNFIDIGKIKNTRFLERWNEELLCSNENITNNQYAHKIYLSWLNISEGIVSDIKIDIIKYRNQNTNKVVTRAVNLNGMVGNLKHWLFLSIPNHTLTPAEVKDYNYYSFPGAINGMRLYFVPLDKQKPQNTTNGVIHFKINYEVSDGHYKWAPLQDEQMITDKINNDYVYYTPYTQTRSGATSPAVQECSLYMLPTIFKNLNGEVNDRWYKRILYYNETHVLREEFWATLESSGYLAAFYISPTKTRLYKNATQYKDINIDEITTDNLIRCYIPTVIAINTKYIDNAFQKRTVDSCELMHNIAVIKK